MSPWSPSQVLRDTPLGVKVTLAPALAVLALGLVSAVAFSGLRSQHEALAEVREVAVVRTTRLGELVAVSERVRSDVFQVSVLRLMDLPEERVRGLREGLEQGLSDLTVGHGQILAEWQLDPTEKTLLEGIQGPLERFTSQARQAVAMVPQAPAFSVLLVRSAAVVFEELQGALAGLQAYETLRMQAAEADSRRAAARIRATILAIAVTATLAVLMAILWISTRLISRPILALESTMGRLARGELAAPVADLARGDELGAMARAVEVFRQNAVEKERLARDLARSNTDLEQFAYAASHDLQEPLRMVTSYLQLLERRCRDRLDDDAREFIGYAVDGATRMKGLINDLLTLSRVGTRGAPLAAVACGEVVEEALANLGAALLESEGRVAREPLPTVLGDRGQLVQVFQNLLGNALKFRGDALPEVHVSAAPDKSGWAFAVRDNGIGIAPEQAERVFEIFQRLHSREEYPGTGIGLALAKKIVERHGGRIWVESRSGEGATFFFTLPAADRLVSPTGER